MMKQQIRLEKWTTTKDASGNNKEGQIKYNLWADVEDVSESRQTIDGQLLLTGRKKFKIYFRPDFKLSGNWKIIYDQSRYTIESITKIDERRFYWLLVGIKSDSR